MAGENRPLHVLTADIVRDAISRQSWFAWLGREAKLAGSVVFANR
jgi:hypothetical protein